MLTDAQREAAINAIRDNLYGRSLADATCALDALLEEFVVIAKDDVTEERIPEMPGRGPRSRRLVTRWEQIAKEDTDA